MIFSSRYYQVLSGNPVTIDVHINEDEPTAGLLRIVRELVRRFCS